MSAQTVIRSAFLRSQLSIPKSRAILILTKKRFFCQVISVVLRIGCQIFLSIWQHRTSEGKKKE